MWFVLLHRSDHRGDWRGLGGTRCGLWSPIRVTTEGTRTPFSIYNNIGGWGGSPLGLHHQRCTGPPWLQMGTLVSTMALFFLGRGSLGPQHPGRQLGSALISGGQNASSGMLRGVGKPAKRTWAHLFGAFDLECASAAALTWLATAISSSTLIPSASLSQPSLACRQRLLAIAALQDAVHRQKSVGNVRCSAMS